MPELWYRDGKVLDYDELRRQEDFRGTGHEVQVCDVEVWHDWGSDGHTEYEFDFVARVVFENDEGDLPLSRWRGVDIQSLLYRIGEDEALESLLYRIGEED